MIGLCQSTCDVQCGHDIALQHGQSPQSLMTLNHHCQHHDGRLLISGMHVKTLGCWAAGLCFLARELLDLQITTYRSDWVSVVGDFITNVLPRPEYLFPFQHSISECAAEALDTCVPAVRRNKQQLHHMRHVRETTNKCVSCAKWRNKLCKSEWFWKRHVRCNGETMDESIYPGFLRLVSCVFSDHAPDNVSPFNVSPFGSLSGNIVAKGGVVSCAEEFSSKTTDSGQNTWMFPWSVFRESYVNELCSLTKKSMFFLWIYQWLKFFNQNVTEIPCGHWILVVNQCFVYFAFLALVRSEWSFCPLVFISNLDKFSWLRPLRGWLFCPLCATYMAQRGQKSHTAPWTSVLRATPLKEFCL